MNHHGREGALGRLFDGGAVAAYSERHLLDRFVATRDELAFEAIVARHGPMVVRVCRAFLTDPTDVDDAFQATFLVLVKKAGSLRDADNLGPWLHGVARRVALQARADSRRRRSREPLGGTFEPSTADPRLGAAETGELAALLHVELDRLASPERLAVLLCDLEGLSHQEAADQLGWPLGTVKTRVARGRDRLRSRLMRRGVTLSTSAVAATLAAEAVAAVVVPRALVVATTRAALAVVAGRILVVGLVSPSVFTLTQGAARAMIFTKVKATALTLVALTGAIGVPTLVAYQSSSRPEQGTAKPQASSARPAPEVPLEVIPGLADPSNLTSAALRLQVAASAVKSIDESDREGKKVEDQTRLTWYKRLVEAEIELSRTRAERVEAAKSYVERHRRLAVERTRLLSQALGGTPPALSDLNGSTQLANIWGQANQVNLELDEAQKLLARVMAEPIEAPSKANPKPIASASSVVLSSPPILAGLLRIKPNPKDQERNEAILAKLDEPIAMNFPNETPISDVLQYLRQCTEDKKAGLPHGIPIYVDPKSLQAVDKTTATTVTMNFEGIPLRTTLSLILDQIDMTYVVEGGLLMVLSQDPTRTPPVVKQRFQ